MEIVEHSFPVLNINDLLNLPKGRKPQDMQRILHSPNSEDWVTWNFFQVLFREHPKDWWTQFANVVQQRNSEFKFTVDDFPTPLFWTSVPSPSEYEKQSRAKMKTSGNAVWASRAEIADPVEGPSEIDVIFDHNQFLVYVEAKLGSDISMRTTYDPQRNQMIRNIDCLIANAGNRTPIFWLLVKDEVPTRAYLQLTTSYKTDPSRLVRDLPHRDPTMLRSIAQNLTILLWSDFRDLVCEHNVDPEVAAVKRELERRIRAQHSCRFGV